MTRKTSNPFTQKKEIAANQRGRITRRQLSRLGRKIHQKQGRWFNLAVASIIPTIAPVVPFLVSIFSDSESPPIYLLYISAGLFCIWLAPAVLIYLRWRRLDQNLAHEPIAQGDGEVYWKRTQYVLKLADGKKVLDPIDTPNLLPG